MTLKHHKNGVGTHSCSGHAHLHPFLLSLRSFLAPLNRWMWCTRPELHHLHPYLITLNNYHIFGSPSALSLVLLIALPCVSLHFSPILCTFPGDRPEFPVAVSVCHAINTGWRTLPRHQKYLLISFWALHAHAFQCNVIKYLIDCNVLCCLFHLVFPSIN